MDFHNKYIALISLYLIIETLVLLNDFLGEYHTHHTEQKSLPVFCVLRIVVFSQEVLGRGCVEARRVAPIGENMLRSRWRARGDDTALRAPLLRIVFGG